jgi:hypothetical protein
MAEQQEVAVRPVMIRLAPFDTPEAQDYYMNLTGVVNTQYEVILMFARALPLMAVPESGVIDMVPALRVAIPAAAGRHLVEQLVQMLELRERQEAQQNREESKDAEPPATG